MKNLESKIITARNSLEKIGKVSSSPVSYAEVVKTTTFTNDMKFQRPRYPLNGSFSILGLYNTNCYLQVRNRKKNDLAVLFHQSWMLFQGKKQKFLLINNADDYSKVHTEWKKIYIGNPTKTVCSEVSKKLIGIVKDVPSEITEQQLEIDLRSRRLERCQWKR